MIARAVNALAVLVQLQIMSNFLLALDQSTATTGYAVFKGQELLTYGHISPIGKDYMERISKLREWLARILDTMDGDIEVAIEDIQLQEFEPNGGKRARDFGVVTYKKLAHVQGALLSLLVERNIKYQVVPSASWKKTCKIAGKHRDEQKRNAQAFAMSTYGLKPTQDEADAVCIAHHVLHSSAGFDWS